MGIDIDVAKFLLSAREREVDFRRSLMLGNQKFDFLKPDYQLLSNIFKLNDFTQIETGAGFLQYLGADQVSAMDFSDYEGAAILHDLNKPIGDDLKEKFSFVLDGGTLEHIFNFPVALANAMEMLEIGGHLMVITGGNNFLGHGFYQFSPELFYRALSEENGFQVKRMIAAEVGGRWFEVADPKKIKGRVELINEMPVYLMTLAQKTSSKTLFAKTPQQSDYVEMWNDAGAHETDQSSFDKIKNILKSNEPVRKFLSGIKQKQINSRLRREKSFGNSRAFTPVDK